jgi:hypothetical protein
MVWPDGAWAFSRLFGDETTRLLASISCVLAAIGFVAGGIGLFARQAWWHPVVVGPAVFSAVIFVLFWNGQMQNLMIRAIAILINIAILVAVLVLRWPDFEFGQVSFAVYLTASFQPTAYTRREQWCLAGVSPFAG